MFLIITHQLQMNASALDQYADATITQNETFVHLPAPILPEMSNMTILRDGNGTILEGHQIFLNTMTAQALSGIFVWSALLMTCHQVSVFVLVVVVPIL